MKQIVLRNEKQFGRKSWISTCKYLQNGRSFEKQQVAGVLLLQAIEFYTKTRQINRMLSEERRK